MLAVQSVSEVLPFGVDFVDDRVCVLLLRRRENGHLVVGRQVLETLVHVGPNSHSEPDAVRQRDLEVLHCLVVRAARNHLVALDQRLVQIEDQRLVPSQFAELQRLLRDLRLRGRLQLLDEGQQVQQVAVH